MKNLKIKSFNAIKNTSLTLVVILLIFKLVNVLNLSISKIGLVILDSNKTSIFIAVLLLVLYQALNSAMWSQVLSVMSHKVGVFNSARVWLSSEACKWLPGGVWTVASRVSLAKKLGLNKKTAGLSLTIELCCVVLSWFLLAFLSSLYLYSQPAYSEVLSSDFNLKQYINFNLLLVLTLAVLASIVLLFLCKEKIIKKLKPYLQNIDLKNLGSINFKLFPKLVLLYSFLAFFNGLIFYFVCDSILNTESSIGLNIGLAVACNSFAWIFGFFAIFAPGGIGVREAVIVLFLSPSFGVESAIACATVWRSLQIISEVISLSLVYLISFLRECLSSVSFSRFILSSRITNRMVSQIMMVLTIR